MFHDTEWPAEEYTPTVAINGIQWIAPYVPDSIHCMDALELAGKLPAESVDMILADLPYGTTACKWDERIPLEPMWEAFERIIKPRGAIVLTATQPFTSMLVMSWPEGFRYSWVWVKKYQTSPMLIGKQPLRRYEDVLVFGERPVFYPQNAPLSEEQRRKNGVRVRRSRNGNIYGDAKGWHESARKDHAAPTNVIEIDEGSPFLRWKVHPTQKPVALFEYLIKTYTQPEDVVFDPVVGAGTTAVAAKSTGRRYIVGDMLEKYAEMTQRRVQPEFGKPAKRERAVLPLDDLPLFAK